MHGSGDDGKGGTAIGRLGHTVVFLSFCDAGVVGLLHGIAGVAQPQGLAQCVAWDVLLFPFQIAHQIFGLAIVLQQFRIESTDVCVSSG